METLKITETTEDDGSFSFLVERPERNAFQFRWGVGDDHFTLRYHSGPPCTLGATPGVYPRDARRTALETIAAIIA